MELIRELIRQSLYQLIMILMILIVVNGIQVRLCQSDIVKFSGLVQLICHIRRLYHVNGYCIKAFGVCIPVSIVLGQNFFISLNVAGHDVWSVVPHIFIVACQESVDAQFVDQCLRSRIQTLVSCNGWEVRFFRDTGIDNGVIIRCRNSNHIKELTSLIRGKRTSFFFTETLGIIVIILSPLNQVARHRNIRRTVLVIVQYELQTRQEILRGTVCLFLAVHVYPFHTFTQVERPGNVIFGIIGFRQTRL